MYVHIEQQQTKYHYWNNFHRHFLILLIFHSVIAQFPVLLFYFNYFVNQKYACFVFGCLSFNFFYHFLSIEYTYFPKYFLLWALPLPYFGLVLDFCSLFLDLEIFFLFSIFSSFVSILNIPVYKFEILI